MQVPDDKNIDVELLVYFAEQRGWHDIAEQLTEDDAEEKEQAKVLESRRWTKLYDVFDDQAAA